MWHKKTAIRLGTGFLAIEENSNLIYGKDININYILKKI